MYLRDSIFFGLSVCLGMALPYANAQTKIMVPNEPKEHVTRLPGEPPDPDPKSYGMDAKTGVYRHPAVTPESKGQNPFPGALDFLDQNEYRKNTKVEAFYPLVVSTGHSWQVIFDMNNRRYMYDYYRTAYKVYDITDPRALKVVAEKTIDSRREHPFGPFAVQYNQKLNKMISVMCYETPRFGILENKYTEPDKVNVIRNLKFLRGFRIYEMNGPVPTEWKMLSEVALDPFHASDDLENQQGSGCLDVPVYFGDKYLFVAGAPDNSFANTEYKSYLYSGGQLAFDISDPSNPKRLATWWAPGQRLGEEAEYKKNPRAGNKTSWMGARMPVFVPKPVEKGGKYGYTAMGGFGFYVLDISDPAHMKAVGHLDMPVSIGGTEGDNVDVSKVEQTGIVYYSGYPMNDDCYEPYKDIYAIDVKDPTHPKIVGTLPRPTPPKEAPFTDYCQRRGSFGPKRTGYYLQPGTPNPKYLPYAFYNAGVQMFDVSDPLHPTIAAYFVPKMVDAKMNLEFGNPIHGIYVEWDRNLIWAFANHGVYAISSPLLGEPVTGLPKK